MTFCRIRALRVAVLLPLCFATALFLGMGLANASGGASSSEGKEGTVGHKEGAEVKKQGKSDQEITGGRFSGDPIYVHLPVLILPVISSKGAQQIVTLLINVEVDNFGVANDIHDKMPHMMDALMRALYGKLGEGDLLEGKLVNIDRVKEQATKAVTEVTGSGKVRNILIQGVAQRIY
ncbi:MAG: hypothetical protein ABTQ34_03550 [Bdellovibrionales bacterium]